MHFTLQCYVRHNQLNILDGAYCENIERHSDCKILNFALIF